MANRDFRPSGVGMIYPHERHYVSSNEVFVMLGDLLIDEAVGISYSVRESKVPVYQYNSKHYNRLAHGKVFVQGSLVLNYVDADYMYFALLDRNTKNGFDIGAAADQVMRDYYGIMTLADTEKDIAAIKNNPLLKGQDARAVHIAKRMAILGSKQYFKALKQKYWNAQETAYGAIQKQQGNLDASTMTKVDFRAVHPGLQNRDRGFFYDLPPVDIVLSHGNPLDPENRTYRVIKNAAFVSNEMQSSPTGQVQTEIFGFVAPYIL